MVLGLKSHIEEVEGLYYLCSENKGADQLHVAAHLICVFIFAYEKSRFSQMRLKSFIVLFSHLSKQKCIFNFV